MQVNGDGRASLTMKSCASAGLATVVRGWISRRVLADALSLNEDEIPILAQTVGFPQQAHA